MTQNETNERRTSFCEIRYGHQAENFIGKIDKKIKYMNPLVHWLKFIIALEQWYARRV